MKVINDHYRSGRATARLSLNARLKDLWSRPSLGWASTPPVVTGSQTVGGLATSIPLGRNRHPQGCPAGRWAILSALSHAQDANACADRGRSAPSP